MNSCFLIAAFFLSTIFYQGVINYKVRILNDTPSLGDIYEFDNYYLLVTKDYKDLFVFAPLIGGQPNVKTEKLLSSLQLNFHRQEPTMMEIILTFFLGGKNPNGYFGFSVDRAIFKDLLNSNLNYIYTVNLNQSSLVEVGGTSLVDKNSAHKVIERCLSFRLSQLQPIDLATLIE